MYLRHVSNAGILLYAGSRSFGIDVFAKDENGLYMDTPYSERSLIMEQAENSSLSMLIITHGHSDHFHAPDVIEAMERARGLRILTTEAVAWILDENGADMDRVFIYPSGSPGSMRISPPGIPDVSVEIFSAVHDGDRYADVENLVCTVAYGGKKLVSTGDAKPTDELFAHIAKKTPSPDLLVIPFPLVGLPSARRKLAAHLAPRMILACHLPRPESDTEKWRDSALKVCEASAGRDSLPMPVFGDVPGTVYDI